jgi:hypothetical protein
VLNDAVFNICGNRLYGVKNRKNRSKEREIDVNGVYWRARVLGKIFDSSQLGKSRDLQFS